MLQSFLLVSPQTTPCCQLLSTAVQADPDQLRYLADTEGEPGVVEMDFPVAIPKGDRTVREESKQPLFLPAGAGQLIWKCDLLEFL